ncbi:MAG TPA: TRAP transporter TatT component family protein [Polyangia bacterium]|nr:TRAP transporter TatT component family protein [Polyangia bacterium]
MPRSRLLPLLLLAACGTGRTSQWDVKTPAPAAPAAAGESPAAAAEAAWAQRGDRAQLEKAIAQWESALAQKPDDVAILGHLSRAYYLLADGFLRKPEDKKAYLANMNKGTGYGERGVAAASPAFKAKVKDGEKVEEAIKLVGREGIEPMYWYVVNLGKWARAEGLAALLGNKDRAKGVMTRVLELDETFFHGAPHRYFGAYWSLLPVGRDLDKSKQHFDKSLAIAPNYAGTKVLMAETYAVKKQDRALFDKLLGEVLAMPDDAMPGLEPEVRIEKDKARELQAKANELF